MRHMAVLIIVKKRVPKRLRINQPVVADSVRKRMKTLQIGM